MPQADCALDPLHGLNAVHVRQAEVDEMHRSAPACAGGVQVAGAAAPDGTETEVAEHLLE